MGRSSYGSLRFRQGFGLCCGGRLCRRNCSRDNTSLAIIIVIVLSTLSILGFILLLNLFLHLFEILLGHAQRLKQPVHIDRTEAGAGFIIGWGGGLLTVGQGGE